MLLAILVDVFPGSVDIRVLRQQLLAQRGNQLFLPSEH